MQASRAGDGNDVIRLNGVFDGVAARRLEGALLRAEPGTSFQVDLSKVQEFHDFAIAVLANAMRHSQAHVSVKGLRQHHLRLLRYFGVASCDAGVGVDA